ncbi:histone acetyltransferase KAT6A-like [Aedes albopictus]|uniref:Uncharacterized protein n=1 Tax=Aedes albopictus TaxID=7160 RepID=A0ABM1Z6W5_AEDAL
MPNQQLQTTPMDNGTFRQPLPPNMMARPRMPGPAGGIRPQNPGMVQGPNGPVIRQQIIRTASGGQMLITQPMPQQQIMRQRMQLPNRPDGSFVGQLQPGGHVQSMGQPQIGQMQGALTSQTDQQNIALLAQRLAGEGDAHVPTASGAPANSPAVAQGTAQQTQPTSGGEGASEIPDSVSAELEKLEQEDNTGIGEVEGVGDILGGLGDDDDELLDSLTAEMGADFNILEYADPELDTTDGEKSNLLDSLELDEPEGEKSEDKAKSCTTGDPNKPETMDTDEKVDDSKIPRSTTIMQTTVMAATSSTVVSQQQLPTGVMVQSQQQMMQTQQMQTIQQQLTLQQQPQGVGQQQPTQLQQLISGGQPMGPQSQGPPQQLQQQLLAGQMKSVRPNILTPAQLQQIQQQMQQQVQQAAAMGKPMAVGTRLLSKEGAVGVVTPNNTVSVSIRTGALNDPRGQQLKLGHPAGMVQQNLIQGQQQTRIVQQIPGNRIIQTVANPNQPGQAPVGQSVLHQQLQQPTQQPAGAVPVSVPGQPPPPPYPEPPPPYPGSQSGAMPGAPAVNQDFETLLNNQQQQQQQPSQGPQGIQPLIPPGPGPINLMNQPGPIQQGPPQLGPPQLGPAHPGPIQPGPAQQVAPGPDNSNARQITAPPEDDLPPLIQPIPPVAKPNPSASMPSEDTSNQMVPGTVTVPSTSGETPVDGAASVRPPNEGVAPTTDASITAEAAEPGSVAAVSATTAAVTDKPVGEQAAPPPAEPMDEDNLSEISDDPDDILTREEEINQLNDPAAAGENKPRVGDSTVHEPGHPLNVGPDGMPPGPAQHSDGNSDLAAAGAGGALEVKDPKQAGKLHANKELKEEMDLDFEEISDGELEEENKFKGLGDALGVDWASLAQETRAKLKPEQTIPVSARNRWKAHHILLDIGISVRLAGEAYAQRVLTESKEKLREEIEEFKAAAEQQKVAAVKKEEEEQLFNGVRIKKEKLDEDEQKQQQSEQTVVKKEDSNENSEVSEQEANLADIDKILHPVASVHVAMRERARARRNLILCAAGPHSRALSARRDLEIRRQLCGFPPQECNERITEHQSTPTNPELHEMVMKLYQNTMQPNKIEVQ